MNSKSTFFYSSLPLIFIILSACSSPNSYFVLPDFPAQKVFNSNQASGAQFVRPGLFNHSRPIYEAFHPQKSLYAGTIDGDLYLRTGEEKEIILSKEAGDWVWDIEGAQFSPNGNLLWVKQTNDSEVPEITLIDSENEVFKKPYTRAGEAISQHRYFVIDLDSRQAIQVPKDDRLPYSHGLEWNEEGDKFYFVQADRLMKELQVKEFSVDQRESKMLFSESSESYVIGLDLLPGYGADFREKKYVDKIKMGILLQSERSGFNQIYWYDEDGKLIRPLTSFDKNGIVTDIIGVDETNGWVYFIGGNPDHLIENALYRSALHEEKAEKLTSGSYILGAKVASSWDTISVAEIMDPYQIQVNDYTQSGKLIQNFWTGSLEDQKTDGYDPQFLSIDLSGTDEKAEVMILKPVGFDPKKSYPVIEYIYGGAFTQVIQRVPLSPQLWQLQSIANEGYMIVMIDSRGTPGKGKKYQDYSYGSMGQVEIHDHAEVIEKLGNQFEYFDLDRVGIMGHSWGGYFTLRAMIMYPELYKAAHASAPGVDPMNFRLPVEIYMGCLPQDCKQKYEAASVTNFVDRIIGPVQVIHGTADDDVPIEEAYELKQAFERVGKTNFELIEFKGADHIIMRTPEWEKNVKSFFKTHLK